MIRRRGSIRRGGQVALCGAAVAALLWLGERTVRYAHGAEAFAIREIIIEGNHQVEDIDVRRAARLQLGSNIFEVSTEDARNHLLQHPWIEEASVVRKLPGRVRLEIMEREPVALVALDGHVGASVHDGEVAVVGEDAFAGALRDYLTGKKAALFDIDKRAFDLGRSLIDDAQ